jgi:arginyl-tRNA synthetase
VLKMDVGRYAATLLLKEIKNSLRNADITFDVWTSEEKDIRKKGLVKKTLADLQAKGLVVERDGALWLEKEIAGEKERVLKKSDGTYTYYLVDLAYHRKSFETYDKVINLWGADHHGNVQPMKEGVKLFGIDAERLAIIMFQPVRLIEDGKEVKMSKRAGEFIALDELMKEVGLDVTKFFFLMFTPGNRIDFDLKLAKDDSSKNPVFYVQYAYVRTKSILAKSKEAYGKWLRANSQKVNLGLLNTKEDRKLILELAKFPDLISDITADYEVSRLLRHLLSLARAFHDFYEKERVVGEKNDIALARRALVGAVAVAIEQAFDLLGIQKRKKM